ncbi:dolichyl-P-Man:Man(5)GlcNAc(2)-PP-dolichol alpha-1,3-mannosyltransferase [Geranomyces michiganensis]|nr:dolichyl-P-Man:Man(5)GlcNAc(2)-PP-dolichol alpha-1,3-mannosyltransferase [Geranomyces michiganensis]
MPAAPHGGLDRGCRHDVDALGGGQMDSNIYKRQSRTPAVSSPKNEKPHYARQRPAQGLVASLFNAATALACDPAYYWIVGGALLALETVLCTLIIRKVSYTNIDWDAYMQEVGGFLAGERDYAKLEGDTGPLVYPAGFVYVYSALWYITNAGKDIRLAQYLFAGLYIVTLIVVMAVYRRSALVR